MLDLSHLLSVPKSLYFCFRTLKFKDAIKLPILIHYNTRLRGLRKGVITLKSNNTASVVLGFGGTDSVVPRRNVLHLGRGSIRFGNNIQFSEGFLIKTNGRLIIGDHFTANRNCTLSCTDTIYFGEDVMLGWNIQVRNGDGHVLLFNGEPKPNKKEIKIGNHVWIAAESHILKGVEISDNCVVAYGSLLTKSFPKEGCLIAGHPAIVKSDGINWIR